MAKPTYDNEAFYLVYRDHEANTYGVYQQPGDDGTGSELIEGGFQRRAAAEACRDYMEATKECPRNLRPGKRCLCPDCN